jgi:hypothetical protein
MKKLSVLTLTVMTFISSAQADLFKELTYAIGGSAAVSASWFYYANWANRANAAYRTSDGQFFSCTDLLKHPTNFEINDEFFQAYANCAKEAKKSPHKEPSPEIKDPWFVTKVMGSLGGVFGSLQLEGEGIPTVICSIMLLCFWSSSNCDEGDEVTYEERYMNGLKHAASHMHHSPQAIELLNRINGDPELKNDLINIVRHS